MYEQQLFPCDNNSPGGVSPNTQARRLLIAKKERLTRAKELRETAKALRFASKLERRAPT